MRYIFFFSSFQHAYYCDRVGKPITLSMGSFEEPTFPCTDDDVLTAEKRAFLENDLLVSAQRVLARLLRVRPIVGGLKVGPDSGSTDLFTCGAYGGVEIPLSYRVGSASPPVGSAGANADVLVFVTAWPTQPDTQSAVLAYARSCRYAESGRPIMGHINFSPLAQRTSVATDAMFLMMRHAFGLGYRRYEWKCDALNAPSRAAAERLGFTYEGLFRQATIYKGRSRDTAWYSILDREYPTLEGAYLAWLASGNRAGDGRQVQRLADLIAEARRA